MVGWRQVFAKHYKTTAWLDSGIDLWYHYTMNNNQLKTYKDIYSNPIKSDINWDSIESLFIALGAKISKGNGSRIRIELNGERAVFHRPHPERVADKGAIKSVRKFLENAEVKL